MILAFLDNGGEAYKWPIWSAQDRGQVEGLEQIIGGELNLYNGLGCHLADLLGGATTGDDTVVVAGVLLGQGASVLQVAGVGVQNDIFALTGGLPHQQADAVVGGDP